MYKGNLDNIEKDYQYLRVLLILDGRIGLSKFTAI